MPKVLLVDWGRGRSARHDVRVFSTAGDGFEVVVAAPDRRLYHLVMHEKPPGLGYHAGASGYVHLPSDIAFRDVHPDEYAGLFCSGGRAPKYLRYNADLLRITRWCFESNRPVATPVHGIEIIAAADCIRNRTVTTIAKCALDATQAGAT